MVNDMTNEELVQQYKSGNVDVLPELIDRFEKRMEYICYKYSYYASYYNLDIEDLMQEAWLCFINAINSYEIRVEEKENCSFFSFAYTAVEYSIKNTIRKNKPLGFKTSSHSEAKKIIRSLDAPINTSSEHEEMTLYDITASCSNESKLEYEDYILALRHDLLTLLDEVFTKESKKAISAKDVLLLHYGLYGEALTLAEIAIKVNKTASYIGEIENQAINRIRNSIPGRAFLNKYRDEQCLFLQTEKESVDLKKNPESVTMQLDSINLLIQKYCN